MNRKLLLVFSCLAALPLTWANISYAADQDRAALEAREEQKAWVSQSRESVIDTIVSTWSGLIELNGGSPSQLRSTLQHASDDALLKASEANDIAELNEILD